MGKGVCHASSSCLYQLRNQSRMPYPGAVCVVVSMHDFSRNFIYSVCPVLRVNVSYGHGINSSQILVP